MLKLEVIALASFGLICLNACGGTDVTGVSAPTSASTTPPTSVTTPTAPSVTLTSSSAKVSAGATVTLTWSTANASACTASGAWSGTQTTNGSAAQSLAAAGSDTFTLTCSGSGGSAAASTTVTVAPVAPVASAATFTASPISLSFGTQTTGTVSPAQSVALSYTGTTALTNIAVSISGDFTQATTCGASLAAAGTCTVSVIFKPTATGVRTGTLTVASSFPGGSVAVALSGTGAAPAASTPVATVTPTSLSFASQSVGTRGTSQAVTLTNAGNAALANVAVSASGDFSETNTCAASLAAAASCTITVSFSPTAAGQRTGTLTIASNATGSPNTVALSGTGAAASTLVASVTPTSLTFASQTVGTRSISQVVTLKNSGNAVLSNVAVSVSGDFSETNTCAVSLAAAASCAITVSFSPTATGLRTGTLTIASNATGSPNTVALSGTGGATSTISGAMTLISRGLPIYASNAQYPATDANDDDYNTAWRSVGVPTTLALDLSSVPTAERQHIWLVWYNDDTYGYDHATIGQPGYNNPGAYTLEANAAAGGGAAPTSGWVQLESLAGNTLDSYSYLLNFAGYNWVRLNFTASDGSAGNSDIAINLDVYSAPNGVTDGWFFNGDSITANCMRHTNIDGQDQGDPTTNITLTSPSFGQQVYALTGDLPEEEDGGIPGFNSGNMLKYLAGWLTNIPSKYVTINLGTNDAAGVAPAIYYSNMQQLVEAVIGAGKTPIIPTIPFSVEPTHQANEPALNAQLAALYHAYPAIVPGPDLYSYFQANPQDISADGLHPNAQGCVAYRALWAQFAATTIYGH